MNPNRKAALGGTLAAAVAAAVSLLGAVPDRWKGPVLIAAMVCATALGVVWLLGWQKHEARQHRAAPGGRAPAGSTVGDAVADPEPGDPDGLPHLDTTPEPLLADGDDQEHAR